MNSVKTVTFLKDVSYNGNVEQKVLAAKADGHMTFFCQDHCTDEFRALCDQSDEIYVLNEGTDLSENTVGCLSHAVKQGIRIAFEEGEEALLCPCCRAYFLTEKNSYEICPVCGWEDDPLQRRDPDFPGGANKLSLSEARRKLTEETDETYM